MAVLMFNRKPRHILDFDRHPTYVVNDFIRVNFLTAHFTRFLLTPDFRWASVPWMPGSKDTVIKLNFKTYYEEKQNPNRYGDMLGTAPWYCGGGFGWD